MEGKIGQKRADSLGPEPTYGLPGGVFQHRTVKEPEPPDQMGCVWRVVHTYYYIPLQPAMEMAPSLKLVPRHKPSGDIPPGLCCLNQA